MTPKQKAKSLMKKIFCWIHWLFTGKLETLVRAEDLGLSFVANIYGDAINWTGCRSIWSDQYGNLYGCEELNTWTETEIRKALKEMYPKEKDYQIYFVQLKRPGDVE